MTRIDGRLTRLTLGEWPAMSLSAAHQAARETKTQAKAGYRRNLKGPRLASWQDRPIGNIGRRDVMDLLGSFEAEGSTALLNWLWPMSASFSHGAPSVMSSP